MKTTRESFQMTSGSVQGVQEREQDIWKKVCEQLTDITSCLLYTSDAADD
mgnify:CR=1 FL=1